ncbi:MAG: SRPBCC family protein [Phycisphaerales bacterium]|nr:SRPBCC family protein [Phycisphaerales bacterium]MCI0677348.1 SRPBCC family protein [Phycisphaerales bacterium]
MQVSTTRRISAPRDQVFAVVTDFVNAPKTITSIKKCEILSPGPVGKGTRFRETRVMFGRQATETMEITEWNPPVSYTLGCDSCGCRYRSTITCKADGDATLVEMSFAAQPLTFMAKLLAPLGKLMAKSCRKAFEKDLDDLDRSLRSPMTTQPA